MTQSILRLALLATVLSSTASAQAPAAPPVTPAPLESPASPTVPELPAVPAQPAAPLPTTAIGTPADQRIRCRNTPVTGSLTRTERVCMSVADWRRANRNGNRTARALVEAANSCNGGAACRHGN